jgi:adenylosuccinate synthase
MIKGIVGLQFGDEGKGKATDYFAEEFNNIVRFSGGINAGHTVCVNNQTYKFSQLPAVVHDRKNLFLSHAVLIEPETLLKEIKILNDFKDIKLFIDPRAHLVLPIHPLLNQASESYKGSKRIGSVGKGIGACYEDKINRVGVRIADIFDEDALLDKINFLYTLRSKQINHVFGIKYDDVKKNIEQTCEALFEFSQQIKKYISYVNEEIEIRLKYKQNFLLEGSQATFLDNGLGSYPYTVAYPTLMTSCFYNMGIPVQNNFHVIGVMKAYTIRVGEGPFPTELFDENADLLRKTGNEYGTVSGRMRRCGWLDLNIIKHAIELNGVDEIMITNIDVLSVLEKFYVCYQYEKDKRLVKSNEACFDLTAVKPIYKEFESWDFNIDEISQGKLPKKLIEFISYIEDFLEVPITTLSYGKDRKHTLRIVNIRHNSSYYVWPDKNIQELAL